MKPIRCVLIAVLFAAAVLSGCRKEDMTPYYDYVGGPSEEESRTTVGAPAPMPATEQPNVGAVKGARDLAYRELSIVECNPLAIPEGSGFINTEAEFAAAWNEWCPGKTAPSVDFAANIVAYYFKNAGGCDDLELAGARTDGTDILVDIKTIRKKQPCYCPMILKTRRFLVAVERIDGAPSFSETVVEVSCE